MAKRYVILQIPAPVPSHGAERTVTIEGQDWRIGNPDLLIKHPPAEIPGQPHLMVGLFWYEPADQFAFYIPTVQIRQIKTGPAPALLRRGKS